jgi:uncharacterized protein (DUF849 family)
MNTDGFGQHPFVLSQIVTRNRWSSPRPELVSGLARLALERGGHVRAGLEDYAGPRTPSNVELVEEVAALARQIGRPLATPAEAARTLDLLR